MWTRPFETADLQCCFQREEKSKYKQDDSQLLPMLGLYSAVYMNTMNNDFFEGHLNGITIDAALQFSVSVWKNLPAHSLAHSWTEKF